MQLQQEFFIDDEVFFIQKTGDLPYGEKVENCGDFDISKGNVTSITKWAHKVDNREGLVYIVMGNSCGFLGKDLFSTVNEAKNAVAKLLTKGIEKDEEKLNARKEQLLKLRSQKENSTLKDHSKDSE